MTSASVLVQDASLVPAVGSGPQPSGKALSSAASYTQARMHACLLARELQDSQQHGRRVQGKLRTHHCSLTLLRLHCSCTTMPRHLLLLYK